MILRKALVIITNKRSGTCRNLELYCQIIWDLDTVVPGHFISDVGDMMRTYLSLVDEEKDFVKIEIRADIFEAIVPEYYSEMKTDLTAIEKQLFFYAGKFMIYMQAIRFLTDYLNDDVY